MSELLPLVSWPVEFRSEDYRHALLVASFSRIFRAMMLRIQNSLQKLLGGKKARSEAWRTS